MSCKSSLLWFICFTLHFLHLFLPARLFFFFDCVYWMSSWNDAIWLPSCSFSMVSMATMSSDWGQGSNWPIVSKLHFSEWFPLSCYWNRAPVPLMDTSCHSQFRRQEGKVQTWHRGGGSSCSNKEAAGWINTETHLLYSKAVTLNWTTICMLATTSAVSFRPVNTKNCRVNGKSSWHDGQVHTSPLWAVY